MQVLAPPPPESPLTHPAGWSAPESPRTVRRWTLLVVSHDREAPQSFPVTERTLRAAGVGIVLVLAVAMVGVGTIIARLGRLGGPPAPATASAGLPPSRAPLVELEGRVDTLRAVVDSMSALDDSLTRATASTDSLIDRARLVKERLHALDSTARRSRPRPMAP